MSGNYLAANPFAEWVGRTVLGLMGWRIEGRLPALDKFVVIGAHHTSNWDFVIFLAVKFVLRLNARWFGKHSIFRWPFAGLLQRWGGIPVRRHLRLNSVEQAIQSFREHSEFILVLSPEGTRKKVESLTGPSVYQLFRHAIPQIEVDVRDDLGTNVVAVAERRMRELLNG